MKQHEEDFGAYTSTKYIPDNGPRPDGRGEPPLPNGPEDYELGQGDEPFEQQDSPRASGKDHNSAPIPLPFIDMSTWDSTPPPKRLWHVEHYIPTRQPTLLSGEGAIGKSILMLQLLASTVLGRDWIGLQPALGPA